MVCEIAYDMMTSINVTSVSSAKGYDERLEGRLRFGVHVTA